MVSIFLPLCFPKKSTLETAGCMIYRPWNFFKRPSKAHCTVLILSPWLWTSKCQLTLNPTENYVIKRKDQNNLTSWISSKLKITTELVAHQSSNISGTEVEIINATSAKLYFSYDLVCRNFVQKVFWSSLSTVSQISVLNWISDISDIFWHWISALKMIFLICFTFFPWSKRK